MIRILCPNCRSRFTVDDRFAGKRGKCARCGASLRVPEASSEEPAERAEAPAPSGPEPAQQHHDPEPSGSPGPAEASAGPDDPLSELAAAASGGAEASSDPATPEPEPAAEDPGAAQTAPAAEAQPVQPQAAAQPRAEAPAARAEDRQHRAPDAAADTSPPPRAWTLGVTSVALAVVALLVCWIPWIGIVSLSLSLVGLVLGVVALIMALARRNTGLGFPAAGSVLSFLTLLLVTQLILSAIEGPLKMISGLTGGGTTGSGGGIGALLGEPGAADPGQQGQPRITRESTARVSREPIESQTEPEPADPSPQTQDSEAPGEPSTAAPDNADGEPKDTGAAQNLAATAGAASADGAPKEPKRPAAAPDAEPGEGDAAKGSEGSSGTTAAEDEFAEQVAAVREALQRRSDPTGQPDRTRRMRQRPQVQRQRQPQQPQQPQQDQEKNPAKDAEGSEGPDEKQDSSGDPGWIPASEAAIYNGELEVRIVSAKVGRFSVPDLLGNRQRRMRLFGVTVRLHNRSDQRKYDYLSWTGPGIDLNDAVHSQNPMATLRKLTQGAQSEMRPQLADNFGNRYEQHIGASTDYLLGGGGPETESIRPGESIEDTILFEEPVAKADQLRLQLPARYFGGEGVIRFEIPAEMVEGLE